MCDPLLHIEIHHVVGTMTGDALKECYFQWVREDNGFNIYDFFDKNGQLIIPGLQVGSQFNFELSYVPNTVWALSMTAASCTFVAGQWADAVIPATPELLEADQSYQAQAGGSIGAEMIAVAATA